MRIDELCGPFLTSLRMGNNDLDRNGALGINFELPTCQGAPPDFWARQLANADEGANTARNNGDPRQCVFIVCTRD